VTGTCDKHGVNTHTPRRYPLQPLADHFPGLSLRAICEQLKVSGSTYEQYLCHGVIAKTADMLAARAELPALYVWPELVAESELVCVECGERFLRTTLYGPTPKYCGKACRNRVALRAYRRRRRQNDPDYVERERAYRRAYYADAREYETRAARQYYDANRDEILARRRARRRQQETAA
jgi:hypothetical protein